MAAKTEQFQSSGSNFGSTIRQSFNLIRGKDVPNYTLLFMSPTKKQPAGTTETIFMPNIVIGRGAKCHVRYSDDNKTVSREHASISANGSQFVLNHNPGAKNPTLVNGGPISGPHMLRNGDEIQFSYDGPKVRFNTSQVKSSTIGLTSRLGSAVGQALQPYKKAVRILGALLIASLAFGGYNLYQNKQLGDTVQEQQYLLDEKSNEIADLDTQIDQAKRDRINGDAAAKRRADEALRKLDEQRRMAEAQASKLRQDIAIANRKAEQASSTAKAVDRKVDKEKENEVKRDKYGNIISDPSSGNSQQSDNSNKGTTDPNKKVTAGDILALNNNLVNDPNFYKLAEDAKKSVYLLVAKKIDLDLGGKKDDIDVGDIDKFDKSIIELEDRSGIYAATAFLTTGGWLMTARRNIQPWRYNKESSLYKEINTIEGNGGDIYVSYDTYGYKGSGPSLSTKDSRVEMNTSPDQELNPGGKYEPKYFKKFGDKKFLGKRKIERRRNYAAEDFTDWAKIKYDNRDGAISIERPESLRLKAGTVLHVFSYSNTLALQASNQRVEPLHHIFRVAQNNTTNRVIHVSGDYDSGMEGAPALIWVNGDWVVMGILTQNVGSSTAIVVPLQRVE